MNIKIAYVEHPISKEEKKAYIKKGFDKVIDIKYAPSDLPENCKTFKKPEKK